MGEDKITSRKNPLVQGARAVRDGREKGLIFVEGLRLCEEAVRARLDFEFAFHTAEFAADVRGARIVEGLRRVCPRVYTVGGDLLDSIADTKTPQGVVAIARRPGTGRDIIARGGGVPLVVMMHGANNPANAGAMLRVAEAAGASAAVSTHGSTDLLSPKALRGSMGSALRLPLWTGATFEEALAWCKSRGIRAVATDASAEKAHTEIDWTVPRAVIVGPEAGGLLDEEVRAAGESLRIPMRPPVESLNVATALAVILYEAARQRGFGQE